MVKHKKTNTCISGIYITKPVNIEFLNELISNNNNQCLLLKKRMIENIRNGHLREALIDAELLNKNTPDIETKFIVIRLYLCMGDVPRAMRELGTWSECAESSEFNSRLFRITKIDAEFINALSNKLDNLDIIRQDYILESMMYTNPEYLWVDFMPYLISRLNMNDSEAKDWLKLLISHGNSKTKKIAVRILLDRCFSVHEGEGCEGLFFFLEWIKNRDRMMLYRAVQSSCFPDGIYVIANMLLCLAK